MGVWWWVIVGVHPTGLAPGFDAVFSQFNELVMAQGQDDGGVLAGCGDLGLQCPPTGPGRA